MAAQAATYFESGRSSSRRIEERNARLFAEQQRLRRGPTLEVFFPKRIDNSRLVKAPDTVRVREMRIFAAAVTMLFSLVMFYGWQHFSSIEIGYNVEAKKQQVELLREQNRQLKLTEAELSQPNRIDSMARQMGLTEVQPQQVVHTADQVTTSAPALAQMNPAAGKLAPTP
ncbi:cell division protein FtsL [Acidicapsa dinghuensis]|uniref:Cell division protein FtsL n=1 Tax=Acidicapsa dinghuensis TaxID=2218256 RepID=A0ABW1EIG1_9BACT|nr:cell division protein FtsL [Acidicapsa dinghuensis]